MIHLLSKIAAFTPPTLAQVDPTLAEPRELGGTFWLPPAASTTAEGTDFAFMAITYLSYFFFVGICIALGYFVWKYRQKGNEVNYQADAPLHNTPLEVSWTVLPLLLVVAIFFMGFKGFLDLTTPPRNAYEINATAYQWGWSFKYPNGASSDHLVIPAGQPVKMVMRSSDVLHSFYIPDFRVKQDIVPGRYSYLWFQCDEPTGLVPEDEMDTTSVGHHLFCTEYCGTDHSNMNRKVFVLNEEEFEEWEEEQARWLDKVPDEELYSFAGPRIYAKCANCHSIDGEANTGPSWGDPTSGSMSGLGEIWARTVAGTTPVTGGTKGRPNTTLADYIGEGKLYGTPEDYILASIYNPGEILVGGYGPNMPHFRGQLGDRAIDAVIGMMKNLDQFDNAGKFVGNKGD